MPDRLANSAPDPATCGYSYEPDEPEEEGGRIWTATAAVRSSGASTGFETREPESDRDSLDDSVPSGSCALTARFLARPSLPRPAEPSSECVSVGYLRAVTAPPGTPPAATSVGLEDYVALESRPVTDDRDAYELRHPGSTEAPPAGSGNPGTRQRNPSIQAAPGPSYEQVRREQTVGIGAGLFSLEGSTAVDVASQLTETTALGAGAAIAGSVVTLTTLDSLYARAHEEGAELRQAIDRDAANLAVVLVGNQALPRTYVDAARHEYRNSEWGAIQVLTAASRNDASYQQLVLDAERDIRDGRAAARAAGLDSRELLEHKLESDPTFRDRYWSNAGFRHGAQAEVMLGERGYRD